MSDENYIVVQGWMINKLGLKGRELLTFALLYGFCRGGGCYCAGRKYIADWLGETRLPTVSETLRALREKGLIEKNPEGYYELTQYALDAGKHEYNPYRPNRF